MKSIGVFIVLFVYILLLDHQGVEGTNQKISKHEESEFSSLIALENPDAHYAISRTKTSPRRYSGAAGTVTIWKPTVTGQQYSAARLILANGPDNIEVGWRVDPVLFGDDKCRMYIKTTRNGSSFFGQRLPGFVLRPGLKDLERVYDKVSQRGGEILQVNLNIARNNEGSWFLFTDGFLVGFWPKFIFSQNGLTQLASYIEWGGEVFSPRGTPKPPMGSGGILTEGDSKLDCIFFKMTWLNEEGKLVTAYELETGKDSPDYKIFDEGNEGGFFGQLIAFGGPGGKP